MQIRLVQKTLGLLLLLFSPSLIPPILIGLFTPDGTALIFLQVFLTILIISICLWFPVRHLRAELGIQDGFLIVVLFWLGLGICGALPFMLIPQLNMPVIDAIFESISGLTTTGATVITGLDTLPKSILFYRQQLQWFGGMGIIVLAVAILPMLGIGGMQLYRAETPGPMKDAKLTPRITETAKALWYLYLSITIVCAICYFIAGMNLFDAITHSFSTVSIGGFSTHDASIGYFDNIWIKLVAVIFMCLSGMNFLLHFIAWQRKTLLGYWRDVECKNYLAMLCVITIICMLVLTHYRYADDLLTIGIDSLFQTVSIATTTGFTTTDYQNWPTLLPLLLLFASFAGACAGSTGGGLKVIRILLLFKQGLREIKRLIHPHAIFQIKLGKQLMNERVIESIWGFFAAYVAVFIILLLALMATGLDQVTAFSAIAACLNNLGPGMGGVSLHYADLTAVAKGLLCIAMLAGRLEIFTLLVLFSPAFWSR